MNEIFEVEISRPGLLGNSTATTMNLPATPFEIADALDKARITYERTIYNTEVLDSKFLYLPQHIPDSANLYELNHLAERLAALTEWEQDCFEGLVTMETTKGTDSIPVDRLINFTHSTEHCQIAFDVHDDESLGKFYVDNDMVDIPELPEVLYEILDYKFIGRRARTDEGGVFTDKGYVVHSGEIAQTYKSGDAVPLEEPGYTIMLEVCKGFFDDPQYDVRESEFLLLPADDGSLERAIVQVDASCVEQCSIRVTDCIVPKLTELISDTLYESECDCYGAVNELAKQLKKLEANGNLVTYKAMVEAALQSLTLEEAIDLTGQAVDFTLQHEMTSPADYAKGELAKCNIPLRDELIARTDLWSYGGKLMEQNLAMITGYGILSAPDGLTIEQCLGRPAPSQGMEMR